MKTSLQILKWTPRIICILAILFVSMFAMDAFQQGRTIWQNLGALFMHLIPSIILLTALIIAWKQELTGGIILTVIGLALSVFVFILNLKRIGSVGKSLGIVAMICLPFVIAGIMFIISHYAKKKQITTT